MNRFLFQHMNGIVHDRNSRTHNNQLDQTIFLFRMTEQHKPHKLRQCDPLLVRGLDASSSLEESSARSSDASG